MRKVTAKYAELCNAAEVLGGDGFLIKDIEAVHGREDPAVVLSGARGWDVDMDLSVNIVPVGTRRFRYWMYLRYL